MQDKIVTIKDIAESLGVSLTTVHKAIYNKKGISEKTRQEILAYIEKNDFRLNKVASALKRRPIRLAALLVEPVGTRRFFYADVLQGVEDALVDLAPFNVELTKYYSTFDGKYQNKILESIYKDQGDSIDGLLLVPTHDTLLNDNIRLFTEKGIKVVTVNSDTDHSTRHACVASDTLMSGRLAAELLCDLKVPSGGQVLLLGGNRDMYNHQRTALGFLSFMQEEAPQVDILELYDNQSADNFERKLYKYLESFSDIAGIYSNTSANSLVMCQAVCSLGLSGKLSVVGSDVFPELIPYFENRTLTALIYQNPTKQGYKGLQSLYYLISGEQPVQERFELSTGIAFRSNAASFLHHT